MSIQQIVVWEVRPTNGSDTNGGGFITGATGTDYSQQNAAQYALTGLTTAAANAIILTASASADMVGNIISITAGTNFIVGFYQILSVSVGVSITVDRNCTTAAGALGTANIGGALKTIPTATGLSTYTAASSSVPGPVKIYVKAESTITLTTQISPNANQSFAIIGYTTTRTDNGQVTITTATNSTNIFSFTCPWLQLFNLKLTNTAATRARGCTTGATNVDLTAVNCVFDGFNIAVTNTDSNGEMVCVLINCEIKNSTAGSVGAVYMDSQRQCTVIAGCYFHGNAGDGFRTNGAMTTASVTITDSIFYNNTGRGIYWGPAGGGGFAYFFVKNTACFGNGIDGLALLGANNPTSMVSVVWNCVFVNNSGWGIKGAGTSDAAGIANFFNDYRNNFFYNNTSGTHTNVTTSGDVIGTGDPFTSSSGADYSLNNTSGAGAACRGAGFPGVLQAGGTGYIDIGPLQHQLVATPGKPIVNSGMVGGFR